MTATLKIEAVAKLLYPIKSMIFRICFFLLLAMRLLCAIPLTEHLQQAGYVEICEPRHAIEIFESFYTKFDELIEFLQINPLWAQKIYAAKERFIRSKEKNYYSTDFFGFYDESKRGRRSQISFYYSTHFHEFLNSRYPELFQFPEIACFFATCLEIQKPYGELFEKAAVELGLPTVFSSQYGSPPILLKVVKYLPSYIATRPHYDGTALSLFLHSTDNASLLLAPYKTAFVVDDFFTPSRECTPSLLLIPGTLLSEFSLYPTPHIVLQSGKVRYATIAFAMRPNHTAQKVEYASLPRFLH
jgi:hypothetical protein